MKNMIHMHVNALILNRLFNGLNYYVILCENYTPIDLKTALMHIDGVKHFLNQLDSLGENSFLQANESIDTIDDIIVTQKLN